MGILRLRGGMQKVTINVTERRARPFSDALLRDMNGGAPPVCIARNKPRGPFTVSLSMKVRNKGRGVGFACQECGKLSDHELVEEALRRVSEQIAAQGGGGYQGCTIERPLGIVGGTLGAFLLRVSEIVEDTMEGNKCVDANWIMVTRGGEQHIVSTPMTTQDIAGKQRVAYDMRRHFADIHVVRYAFVSEAWSPSAAAPDRKPVVLIYVQDDSGAMVAYREIFGDGGPNRTLGQLEIKGSEYSVGRFTNLLPKQRTDLPPITEGERAFIMKQFRLNGQPCGKQEVIWVQGDEPADFPDEHMVIQHAPNSRHPHWDSVVTTPCRIKSGDQIEMSQAVFLAGMRSFIIDRGRDPPITETSAPDRCHLKIPDTVLTLVGQEIPNTENIPIHLGPEEAKQAKDVGRSRWRAKQRKRAMN
jgi:hypothetical protein